MENRFSFHRREILGQMKVWKPKEYFVYFEVFKLHSCTKRSAERRKRIFYGDRKD